MNRTLLAYSYKCLVVNFRTVQVVLSVPRCTLHSLSIVEPPFVKFHLQNGQASFSSFNNFEIFSFNFRREVKVADQK